MSYEVSIKMNEQKLTKKEKALLAIQELSRQKRDKVTVEDVAVQLWKMWPSEFCMKGYPEHPNSDIQKHLTRPLDLNWITGGVSGYRITEKGELYAQSLEHQDKTDRQDIDSSQVPRYISSEINRILSTKVYTHYQKDSSLELFESDLFEFLGTSARSFHTRDRNMFLQRYNTIIKDVIPYLEKRTNSNEQAKNIVKLWNALHDKFENTLKRKQ